MHLALLAVYVAARPRLVVVQIVAVAHNATGVRTSHCLCPWQGDTFPVPLYLCHSAQPLISRHRRIEDAAPSAAATEALDAAENR